MPACQIDTFSAFQVSTGPTDIALVGTREILPPPEVRAFCAIVSGCKSTIRVVRRRYSSGEGGLCRCRAERRGGSLKAQCLTSPWPPCITAHRTPVFQLLRYSAVSALGKCRCVS